MPTPIHNPAPYPQQQQQQQQQTNKRSEVVWTRRVECDFFSATSASRHFISPICSLQMLRCEKTTHTSEHPGESARRLDVSLKNTRGLLEGILGGGVLPVLQILTLFQTKKCNFPLPFSDQTFKIHTSFHTWPLGRNSELYFEFAYFSFFLTHLEFKP